MIRFNQPCYTGREVEYIRDAMARNKICGDGYYTRRVSDFFKEQFGADHALFVTSCSAALDMAAALLALSPGDEVIMPSYNFVSCANSVLACGATIVFADIDPRTMNISPDEIEKRITDRTRAVFIVHYAGVACDMDRILEIIKRHHLGLVEDAAQAVGARWRGRYLGTLGDLGCYSFHESKNYTCGEGGEILINNARYLARAEIIREKGTNRAQFYKGEVDKYSWVDRGSSYLGSDMLAAFLYAQLEELEEIRALRKAAYDYYGECLRPLALNGDITLPQIPPECDSNYHMFYILCPTQECRNRLMGTLKEAGILAVFHYVPLHTSPMGRKLGYADGDLPVTEEYAGRLLRLPMYAGLAREDQDTIINMIRRFFSR